MASSPSEEEERLQRSYAFRRALYTDSDEDAASSSSNGEDESSQAKRGVRTRSSGIPRTTVMRPKTDRSSPTRCAGPCQRRGVRFGDAGRQLPTSNGAGHKLVSQRSVCSGADDGLMELTRRRCTSAAWRTDGDRRRLRSPRSTRERSQPRSRTRACNARPGDGSSVCPVPSCGRPSRPATPSTCTWKNW